MLFHGFGALIIFNVLLSAGEKMRKERGGREKEREEERKEGGKEGKEGGREGRKKKKEETNIYIFFSFSPLN